MKKLTLDETWDLCLKMWKWISRETLKEDDRDVCDLKREWLSSNGFADKHVHNTCFFCEYRERRSAFCELCPAKKINDEFDCQHARRYNYYDHPREFYAELKRLDKIRLSKK